MPIAASILVAFLAQVPSPNAGANDSALLHAEVARILGQEREVLGKLAEQEDRAGHGAQAKAIRAFIPLPATNAATRFRPLPEIVAARVEGVANVAVPPESVIPADAVAVRIKTSTMLFDLAQKAAAPGIRRYALADLLLREVIDRNPDHAESRRLLGFLPYRGGWATPHAVDMMSNGYVLHPKFGWVLEDWVVHLDRGELPGAVSSTGKPREWLPDDQANALRRDWSKGWIVKTASHFEIQTNVPLDEAVAFARRLEDFYQMFFAQFADVIGAEYLPLADRFRNPGKKAVVPSRRFQVAYFAEKSEYVDHFRRAFGQTESTSLGYYMPIAEAKRYKTKPRSYFYRNSDDAIEAHATLYHEASHQMLFETVKSGIDSNRANYWIWEGLGTYYETSEILPDGTIEVGGFVGPRIARARELAMMPGKFLPIQELCAMDRDTFGSQDGDAVYRNYAQAMALAVFLLNGEDGKMREAFLDFVRDAYRGKVRAETLADRLEIPFERLDASFLKFLATP